MSEHEHHHHESAAPEISPVDAGSRALEEALRSSFFIVKVVMAVLLVVFIFSGVKTVGPQEKAVILRFGKPLGAGAEQLLGPGLHWAFPYPIDEVVPIRVGEIKTVTSTVGWYPTTPAMEAAGIEPPPAPSLNPAVDGYVITSDANILHARATLRYRITDPLAYEFAFLDASNTVQNVLNNALFHAAVETTATNALLNTAEFKEKILARVSDQIAALKLGIALEPGDVKVIPPGYVKADFEAVLAAEQERDQKRLAAEGYASTNLLASQADAKAIVNSAQADANAYVQELAADANVFANQLAQYQITPELFRQRRLAETWQKILATVGDKFFLPERVDNNPSELRLLLSREPQKVKSSSTAMPQPED